MVDQDVDVLDLLTHFEETQAGGMAPAPAVFHGDAHTDGHVDRHGDKPALQ